MDDPVLLSRIQFGITAGFHFFFPPISIGLAWVLVILEGLSWRTNVPAYEKAARFFSMLFALTFAVGVASGIVLEFQFGMNWAGYSKFVGDIFGAPLAAEAVFAFFLESSFLGLYLFGRGRLPRGVLWFAVLMVAVGSTISAFWIIAANSWQQTPTGFVFNNGRAELVDFWGAVLNKTTLIRFTHVVMACLVAGSFFVTGICSYLLRKNSTDELAQRAISVSIPIALICSVLLLFPTGHRHAMQVGQNQPAKLAAYEGLFKTQTNAPLLIFGIPDTKAEKVRYRVEFPIPGMLNKLLYSHKYRKEIESGKFKVEDLEVKGLEAFPVADRPPVMIPFFSFHGMVGLGTLFLLLTVVAFWKLLRRTLWESKVFLRTLLWAAPLPLVAADLGWIAAEVGRQPWSVYGILRTADSVSPHLTANEAWFSLILFTTVYLLLSGLYIFLVVYKTRRVHAEIH